MSPTEAAWLAGFFDGEGSLVSYMSGRHKNHKSWQISIANTSEKSLMKCSQITGVGTIFAKSMAAKQSHYKQQYTWTVRSQRNIASILSQIRPFLAIKEEKVDDFFSQWVDLARAA